MSRLPLYVTRARAKAEGMTHEGYLFGVPIWAVHDGGDYAETCAKFAPLELWIGLCTLALQFLNCFREPGDEAWFPLLLKPIEESRMTHAFTSREDWIEHAARHLVDHSEVPGPAAARDYAEAMAEEQAAEHGEEVQDWASPEAAAYMLAAEDWPDP